jgi:hypothetical protein
VARNCDGVADRLTLVFHPELPRELATPECPMRVLQDPRVRHYLMLWTRWQRFRVLPRAGGLEDQLATDLEAIEILEGSRASYQTPAQRAAARAPRREGRRR